MLAYFLPLGTNELSLRSHNANRSTNPVGTLCCLQTESQSTIEVSYARKLIKCWALHGQVQSLLCLETRGTA